ncbi:MAG: zinc-ribbon domain-containing protein, partial [Paenibacillus macerans]|nr:zinc-ribbon domain-containing protein [Paenibacillus macerans]
CGSELTLKCYNCQHELQPSQKFCPECGSDQTKGREG